VAYWGVFLSLKHEIKKEISNYISANVPDEKLCVIVLPLKSYYSKTSEFKWIEPGKEFCYKNSMYDIVRSRINDNNICFYCINDIKETELFASLYQFIEKNITDNFNHNKSMQLIFQKLFNSFFLDNSTFNLSTIFTIHKVIINSDKYLSFIPEKLFPPPKFNS
jgi:hypothetical protein